MKFYKAKWEASTPTKVQVNVPTNTDFMIGTELYVKGEKKDISPSNCTIYTGEYEKVTEKYSSSHVITAGQYVIGDPIAIVVAPNDGLDGKTISPYVSECWIEVDGVKYIVPDEMLSSVLFYVTEDEEYLATEVDGKLVWRHQTYGTDFDYITLDNSFLGMMADLTDAQVAAMGIDSTVQHKMEDSGYNCGVTIVGESREVPVTISPDTSVNGIPAFTMKSLDAEADKLYDVQFTGSNTNVTWNDALTAYNPVEGDLFQYDTFASNKFKFTVLKEITIKAPFTSEGGKYIDLGNDFTNLVAKDKYGNSVFGGELAYFGNYLQLSTATDGVFNVLYLTTSDLATIGYKKSSNYVISNTSGYVESVTLKPGDTIQINKNSGFSDQSPRFWYFQIGPDAYDYKFKLFVNEDELAYGDLDLKGLTEAEVSAIVDDALVNYDSQLSTVNLSGTFDDDSTFSYNFVIKN